MLWTVAAFKSNAAAVTDQDLPYLTDQSLTLDSANHALFPLDLKLMVAYAMGTLVSRVRLAAPHYRGVARPYIRPIENAGGPSSRPQIAEYWRQPLFVRGVEPYVILLSTTTAVAENDYVVLTVGDGNRNAPQGDAYTVRFTSSFAQTANAWTISGALTQDDTLPPGQYSVVGMDTFSASMVAARLVFPGPPLAGQLSQVRPGGVFPQAAGNQGTRYLRWGYLGVFGSFESFATPQLEVVGTAASTNPDLYLDLVQTRIGARAA